MSVLLVDYTNNGEELIEVACRVCYQSYHRHNPPESTAKLIPDVIQKGHFSVLEHASATFKLEDVSRVLTHELVRHRLMSYSQESQRYVCYADKAATDQPGIKGKARKKTKDYKYVTPPDIEEGIGDLFYPGLKDNSMSRCLYSPAKEEGKVNMAVEAITYHNLIDMCHRYYEFLLSKGIKPEDARYILPNATTCDIYVTGNLRNWRHFCQLRCHPRAAWEIRFAATDIKDDLKEKFPNVFFDFPWGPLTEDDYKNIITT